MVSGTGEGGSQESWQSTVETKRVFISLNVLQRPSNEHVKLMRAIGHIATVAVNKKSLFYLHILINCQTGCTYLHEVTVEVLKQSTILEWDMHNGGCELKRQGKAK